MNTAHVVQANILITNATPAAACLAGSRFMTILHDPNLGMEPPSKAEWGTIPFMAPELLVPSRFGLDKCTPSKETDIYAMGMVIHQVRTARFLTYTLTDSPVQVLTGEQPFGKLTMSEVVFKVLGGEKPSKPANALELGLSDSIWKLLEGCWHTERTLRPSVKEVSDCVRAAAIVCGTLPSVGDVPQRGEDPETDFTNFGRLLPRSSSNLKLTLPWRPIIP